MGTIIPPSQVAIVTMILCKALKPRPLIYCMIPTLQQSAKGKTMESIKRSVVGGRGRMNRNTGFLRQ